MVQDTTGRQLPTFLGYIKAIINAFLAIRTVLKTVELTSTIKTYQDNKDFLHHNVSVSNCTFTNNWYNYEPYQKAFSLDTARFVDAVARGIELYYDTNAMAGSIIKFHLAGIALDFIQPEKLFSNKIVGVVIHYGPELILTPSVRLHYALEDANSIQSVLDKTLAILPATTPNALFFINAQCAIDYNNALLGVEKIDRGSHDEL